MPVVESKTTLSDLLNHEIYPRLTAEAVYTWKGHDFQKSKGDKWRGKCPSHHSQIGSSFVVTPSSNLWYCAGCGVGGGPVEYLWRLKNGGKGHVTPQGRDFVDMVRELCALSGAPFPERKQSAEEIKKAQQLVAKQNALEVVYTLSRGRLWSDAGAAACAYLHGRGLDDPAIKDLELGLYPGFEAVKAALRAAGHNADNRGEWTNLGAWDKLEGYITFPWRDSYGKPLTLYGRWHTKTPPDGTPKTNALPGEGSKASPLFYDRARRAGHKEIVLVEGLLDAALLQTMGETNVCAYVGAAASMLQLETLKRHHVESITIVPDPDSGGDTGIKSLIRNIDPAIRVYVAARLPDGQDPDEFVLREGLDGWRTLVNEAIKGTTYQAQSILVGFDLSTPRGKDAALDAIVDYLAGLDDLDERDELAGLAADRLGVKAKSLEGKIQKARKARPKSAESSPEETPTPEEVKPTLPPAKPKTLPEVIQVFQHWLHMPDVGALLVALATVTANRAKGDPIWLLLVAPPGGGKTEIINAVVALSDVYPVATLTEGALLSGTSAKETTKGAKGGLLREIGSFGILALKDFGSILSMNRDARAATLAALRELYDGSWTRHVGVDGGRTLHWEGKIGVLGGCTPSIDLHHGVIGALGERYVSFRIPNDDDDKRARKALGHAGREDEMRHALSEAVRGLFASLPEQIEQPKINDSERDWLISLATLAVRCRSSVERDFRRDIELIPGAESPTRLIVVLAGLLAGLVAIGVDRPRAFELVRKVALDSMPQLRRSALEKLAGATTSVITSAMAVSLGYPTVTMRRTLEDLTCYEIVERISNGTGRTDEWKLTEWAREKYNTVRTVPEMSDGVCTQINITGDASSIYISHTPLEEKAGTVFPEVDAILSTAPEKSSSQNNGAGVKHDEGVQEWSG